jgi:hypothetical protein
MKLRHAVLAALLAVLPGSASWPGPARGAEAPARADPVRIADPDLARVVRRSLRGAARRLRRAECRQILREFKDQDGRALAEAARDQGLDEADPSASLDWLLLYDGGTSTSCARTDVFAHTARPGSRVVRVCGRRFQRVALRNPTLAEASLIHEMLHSLGLGEFPPDPRAITDRVLQLCR